MKNWLKLCLVLVLVFTISTGTSLSALAAQMTLPAGLKTIDTQAFEGSVSIDEVVLPEGITAIGSRAFADSSLTSITLPRSLSSIADDAFEGSLDVKALVPAGSYALNWCLEHSIPYVVTGGSAAASSKAVSISASTSSAAMGDRIKFTLTADNASEADSIEEARISVVYLNASDEVVGTSTSYYGLGTYNLSLVCGGATKALITVCDSEYSTPGETPSVQIALTGGDTYVYFKAAIVGEPYPGGKVRVYASVVNGEHMTGSKKVTLTDELGLFNVSLGTLTASSTRIACDVDIPETCLTADGSWVSYRLYVNIDGSSYYSRNYGSARPCEDSYGLPLGETISIVESIIPAEMPYTYSVKDTSVATINADGQLHGVGIGSTTGTLTTKSGYKCEFGISVNNYVPGEGVSSNPILYVLPVSEIVNEGSEQPLFYIYSANDSTLDLDERLDLSLRFYDASGTLVEVLDDGLYFNADEYERFYPSWEWYANQAGSTYRYVEIDVSATGYEVCEPYTARVRVIRYVEQGKLLFDWSIPTDTYAIGDTVTVTLTCLTPELLNGVTADDPVVVHPLSTQNNAYEIFSEYTNAEFYEGKTSSKLTFKLTDALINGYGYDVPLYCGSDMVAEVYISTNSAASIMYTSVSMVEGESRTLPITYDPEYVPYVVYNVADPDIVSVKNGVVTALSAGKTEVQVEYMDSYGRQSSRWFYIEVFEPASDSLPTLTVSVNADSVDFAKPVPITFRLSEGITDSQGNPADVELFINAYYLDQNKNRLNSDSSNFTFSSNDLVDGVTEDVNIWYLSNSSVYSAAYLVFVPEYRGDVAKYEFDFDEGLIAVTNAPDPDETVYGVTSYETEGIQQGYSFGVRVWRNQKYIDRDVEIALIDAEGNAVATDTYEDGSHQQYLWFDTDNISIGAHTMTLTADGQEIPDSEITVTVTEPKLYMSGVYRREEVGSTFDARCSFSLNGYTCPVTITVSDPDIASVSGTTITYNACGYVTVTATCEHGQSVSQDVIVYNPELTVIPEFYLAPYTGEEDSDPYEVEWMERVNVIIGTTTDLCDIYLYSWSMPCQVQFLDADGNVLYEELYRNLYHDLVNAECQTGWNDDDLWFQGALAGASYVRMDISVNAGKDFTVDPDRCTVTYPLPSIDEYPYPLVSYTYTTAVEAGGDVKVIFTCLNPDTLGSGEKVSLYEDSSRDVILASGLLTKDQPTVTLSYTTPEDFTSRNFYIIYPKGSYTTNTSIYIYLGKITGFGYDSKISVGSTRYFSASYENHRPELTYSTSDESVLVVSEVSSYQAAFKAVGVGTAEAIATTAGGENYSCLVTVYDSSNVVIPEIGFSETQTEEEMKWGDSADLYVETENSPETFGTFSLDYEVDYLDASGNVVSSYTDYDYPDNYFCRKEDTIYAGCRDMGPAYAAGARSVRFTLVDSDYYTVTEGRETVTLPIQDVNEAPEPIYYISAPAYAEVNTPFNVTVACLNPSALSGSAEYTITGYNMTSVALTLSPESPSATVAVSTSYSSSSYTLSLKSTYTLVSTEMAILKVELNEPYSPLAIGSTCTLYSNVTYCSELTKIYASSNPEIATVSETGVVTGVAPGFVELSMTYGPIVRTVGLRVYNSSASGGTPEFRFYDLTPDTAVSPDAIPVFNVDLVSGVENFVSGKIFYVLVEYLDEDGNVVLSHSSNSSVEFPNDAIDTYSVNTSSYLNNAVMKGATQMRVTPTAKYCTLTEDSAPTVRPIADTSEWTSTNFGYSCSDVMHRGMEETITFKMLSTAESRKGVDCVVTFSVYDGSQWFIDGETRIISSDNPTCELTFTVPENATELKWKYSTQFVGSSASSSSSVYPTLVYFSRTPADMAVAVGNTSNVSLSISPSGTALSYVSSDPTVATVSETGVVTGVSAGIAQITISTGRISETISVRVYDTSNTVSTKLSLTAPEGVESWSWDLTGDLVLTANQPVENIGALSYVRIYSYYYDASNNQIASTNKNIYFNFIDSNQVTVHLPTSLSTATLMSSGATYVIHKLDYVSSSSSISYDTTAQSVELPMMDPADYHDPVLKLDSAPSSTAMLSGSEYTLGVKAVNYAYPRPVTVNAYTNNAGQRVDVGTITFTPAENSEVSMTLTAPSLSSTSFTLYVAVENEDGTETMLKSYTGLTLRPAPTAVTTLAELQSEHNYTSSFSGVWSYTVEGATSLAVTFDSQTKTESNYDYLYVTTEAEYAANSTPSDRRFSGTIGAKTVTVEDDTVVIRLTSDSSSNYWGFAVTQIVATMADGSTVTITE